MTTNGKERKMYIDLFLFPYSKDNRNKGNSECGDKSNNLIIVADKPNKKCCFVARPTSFLLKFYNLQKLIENCKKTVCDCNGDSEANGE